MGGTLTSIVILTGHELRHDFFRLCIGLHHDIRILLTVREQKVTLEESVRASDGIGDEAQEHATDRKRSEEDFFRALVDLAPDHSNPVTVPKGAINDDPNLQQRLRDLNPDVLVCYGTSIIREPALSDFDGRFLNVHLGLSPYYRGSGTNFWPLVNCEPEFVGVTFMHIDAGVDTGQVVHQMRATMHPGDTAHSIGNRLTRDVAMVAGSVARNLRHLTRVDQSTMNPFGREERVYRRKDFGNEAVRQARANLAGAMIEDYLANKLARDARAPIVEQWEQLR